MLLLRKELVYGLYFLYITISSRHNIGCAQNQIYTVYSVLKHAVISCTLKKIQIPCLCCRCIDKFISEVNCYCTRCKPIYSVNKWIYNFQNAWEKLCYGCSLRLKLPHNQAQRHMHVLIIFLLCKDVLRLFRLRIITLTM